MNICMFTNTYLPHVGGVARSVSVFTEDLRAMGHNVLVVAPTFENQPEDEDKKKVVRVPAIQNFNGSDFSVRIPLPGAIEDEITEFKPDIIHSHHSFLLGDTALRTARKYELPIVFTHHTLYEQYTHYVPFDSDTMKRFVINLTTEFANLCSRVIAPSRSIKSLLIKRDIETPIVVLPTGVDVDELKKGNGGKFRKKHNIPDDRIIVGHVGRLAWEKNLPYLAAGVARFMKKNKKAVFVVAGKGDAEEEIQRIFAEKGLSDRLVMPGILQSDKLADCYNAMDVFVFASKSETQGLVLMEAMAAGTPVIALRASGVSDVVEDKENGRILRANCSEKAFAEALGEAFDGKKIDQWSRAASQTAQRFSRRNCAEKLSGLYEDVCCQNGNAKLPTNTLDKIRRRLETEWDLLQGKTNALMQSLE